MAHQDPVDTFCAILTAAGQAGEGLAPLLGTNEKCAALFRGKPLAAIGLEAAAGANASEVVAVAGPEVRQLLDIPCAERGANPVDSAKNGVALLQSDAPIVFLPADLPLIQPAHIRRFVGSLPKNGGEWVAAGLVSEAELRRDYPGAPGVSSFRLSGERYVGGGLFACSRPAFDRLSPILSQLADSRKSQFGMARRFGFGGMLRLFLGRLSIKEAEAAGERAFGCLTRVVPGFAPETVLDVDTPEDWRYLTSLPDG